MTGGLRFLALGDSYTIGEGVAPRERWPEILRELLSERGFAFGELVTVAQTGWTAAELQKGIEAADPRGRFDLVSLLIGVNNQYRGLPAEEYRAGFRELLERAAGFAGGDAGRVLVLSIPDWGVTPFAEGRDREQTGAGIDAFNAANHAETMRAGSQYADVTGVSRALGASAGYLAGDGLHPSGVMYARWAGLALPAALAALQGGRAGPGARLKE